MAVPSGNNGGVLEQVLVWPGTLPSCDCHCWIPGSPRNALGKLTTAWPGTWLSPPSIGASGWEMNTMPCSAVSFGSHLSSPIQPGPVWQHRGPGLTMAEAVRAAQMATHSPEEGPKVAGDFWVVSPGRHVFPKAEGLLRGEECWAWAEEQGGPWPLHPSSRLTP